MDENGKRAEHGNRAQFSFTDSQYRVLAHGIAEQMATRYGHTRMSWAGSWIMSTAMLTLGLRRKPSSTPGSKKKYGTIAQLNRLWTTTYWSQTYDNFDEIPVRASEENPALELDWKHFVSDTWKSYSQNQVDAIRPLADPRQFITTNTMGWFDGFDHYTVYSNLDIASWDDYIAQPVYNPALNGATHDLDRGFKRKNFWVMETEPAFVNWRDTNNPLDRGQIREMAWQAVGHGADAVEYWQWRAALNGQEQYHGTLVGSDGLPVPVYAEIQQIGAEFKGRSGSFRNHSPFAGRHRGKLRQPLGDRFPAPRRRLRPGEGVVELLPAAASDEPGSRHRRADAPLDEYKLVEAPALNVLPEAVAQHLIDYVNHGGNLVLGPRSGMKDSYNALYPNRQPGPLAELLGAHVEEFYALEKQVPVSGEIGSGSASVWAECLTPAVRRPEC